MPEVSRFYGIVIYIYFEMQSRHHEPHFHAIYGEHDASFSIDPPALITGSLPRRQRRLVLAWAELHQDELIDNWNKATTGRSLQRIIGLQ